MQKNTAVDYAQQLHHNIPLIIVHVSRIADCLLAPVRKSAICCHDKYRYAEKFINEKKHYYRPFWTFVALQGENSSFLSLEK